MNPRQEAIARAAILELNRQSVDLNYERKRQSAQLAELEAAAAARRPYGLESQDPARQPLTAAQKAVCRATRRTEAEYRKGLELMHHAEIV